jgi:hypothetical protein
MTTEKKHRCAREPSISTIVVLFRGARTRPGLIARDPQWRIPEIVSW